MNLLASLAEFERELIGERVKPGMDRVRRQGKKIGRPSVWDRRGFSRRQAARELDIGYGTLKRLLDARGSKGVA